jgi:hypothetical protein
LNIGRHLLDRIKAIVPETGQMLRDKALHGAFEMGGLWTGNAYRGDMGLLTTGAMPTSADRAQYQSQSVSRGVSR